MGAIVPLRGRSAPANCARVGLRIWWCAADVPLHMSLQVISVENPAGALVATVSNLQQLEEKDYHY